MLTALEVCLLLELPVYLGYELLFLRVIREAVLFDIEFATILRRASVDGASPSAAAVSCVRLPLVGEA